MKITSSANSVLKLKKIIVKDFSFERQLELSSNSSPKITLSKTIDTNKPDTCITLSVKIIADDSYSLSLSIMGVFSISDDIDDMDVSRKVLLEKNAVSIMFPYLRSQITLLTAQPSFQAIVLPPININALLDDEE